MVKEKREQTLDIGLDCAGRGARAPGWPRRLDRRRFAHRRREGGATTRAVEEVGQAGGEGIEIQRLVSGRRDLTLARLRAAEPVQARPLRRGGAPAPRRRLGPHHPARKEREQLGRQDLARPCRRARPGGGRPAIRLRVQLGERDRVRKPRSKQPKMYPSVDDIARALEEHIWCL